MGRRSQAVQGRAMLLRRGSRNWQRCLDLCEMVDKRMWLSMNPLRQFKQVPADVIRRLERKEFPWERYYDLNPQELEEVCGMSKFEKANPNCVH